MRRYPRPGASLAIPFRAELGAFGGDVGLVLSGGGARAAYQAGALKALAGHLDRVPNPISIIIGSSIGSINGLLLGAGLRAGYSPAVGLLEDLWRERTFRNTFKGSPSASFFKAIRLAVLQYLQPGPHRSDRAIFDPSPLMTRIDSAIAESGGLAPENRIANLQAVGVMTTVEGSTRKPLLFVSSHKEMDPETMQGASFEVCYTPSLSAKHGFASAALPSVLPPVELDTEQGKVRLVDGGISQNVPVDPAMRLGARRIILIDVSGRDWWLRRYGESQDTRPSWEVPAGSETFCLRPPETFAIRPKRPLGQLLKSAVSGSTQKFMSAVGPVWPVFKLLERRLGEDVAYETMSYCALDTDYLSGIMEQGYHETATLLRNRKSLPFKSTSAEEALSKVG